MFKIARIIAFALLALSCQPGIGASVESERLRLRPLKQPAPCANAGAKCPLVEAPRINKRVSTIPGIGNPDHGRPPVPILQPRSRSYASPYRTFGGNRGITGGL